MQKLAADVLLWPRHSFGGPRSNVPGLRGWSRRRSLHMAVSCLPSLRPQRFSRNKADRVVRRDGSNRLGPSHVLVHQADPTSAAPHEVYARVHRRPKGYPPNLRGQFSSDSVKFRLEDIVKVKDKNHGFTLTYDMFVGGKCPKVDIYFPCMTLLQFFCLANIILSNTMISSLNSLAI